jgi:hypothetical protein
MGEAVYGSTRLTVDSGCTVSPAPVRGFLAIRQHDGRGQQHVWPTSRVSRHQAISG